MMQLPDHQDSCDVLNHSARTNLLERAIQALSPGIAFLVGLISTSTLFE